MAFTDRQKQNIGHATIAGMAVGGVAGYKSLKPIRRGVAAAKGMKRAGKQAHSLSRGLGQSKPRALANAVGTAPKGRKMVRPHTPNGDFAAELGDSYKKLGGAYAGALVGGVAGGGSLERHYIKQNERKTKVKKSDPFGIEEVQKKWDKTKTFGAGYAGGVVGAHIGGAVGAGGVGPALRNHKMARRATNAVAPKVQSQINAGNGKAALKTHFGALKKVPGLGRQMKGGLAGGVVGTVAGVAAWKHHKKNV